jgi:hypothetical protein
MPTSFPGSPRLVKGGIVIIDPDSSAVQRVIPLQYNPESISRTLEVQGAEGGGEGDRSEPLRLKGPPVETVTLEVEIDATDGLEEGESVVAEVGLSAHLAALETIVYPKSARLTSNDQLANLGTLEIVPMQAPLTLFVWSRNRLMPVRITQLSITEDAFDPDLNPLRAKVNLGLRVLSVDDLGFSHKGGSLYMIYQQQKERLAERHPGGDLGALGIGEIP